MAEPTAEASTSTASAPSVPFFKKKARPRPTARQRSASPPPAVDDSTAAARPSASSSSSAAAASSTSAVQKPSRKTAFNPLVQGTKRKSRRDDDEDAADDESYGLGDDSAVGVTWKASGSAKAANANFVTGGLDWDADAEEEEEKRKRQRLVDVRPCLVLPDRSVALPWQASGGETHLPIEADSAASLSGIRLQAALNDGVPDDGMYHGAAAYKSHIEQRESGVSNKMKAGPQKASSNIRQITVIDYQPDVCKDYKGASAPSSSESKRAC
jgi:RING finger protein 113A